MISPDGAAKKDNHGIRLPGQSKETRELSSPDTGPLDALQQPKTTATEEDTIEMVGSIPDHLPQRHREIVEKMIADKQPGDFHGGLKELVQMGGPDSVDSLAVVIGEAVTDEGALAYRNIGGRHVTVYSVCKAMLKIAGASRISDYTKIEPEETLSKEKKQEVWRFVRMLAKGDHGDIETATGARGLLFERFGEIPGVGFFLELSLILASRIFGTPSGGPPKLLFVLQDLPWAFRSKLGFASVDSRKDNIAEIAFQAQKKARKAKD